MAFFVEASLAKKRRRFKTLKAGRAGRRDKHQAETEAKQQVCHDQGPG
jgi:hypothetical protein